MCSIEHISEYIFENKRKKQRGKERDGMAKEYGDRKERKIKERRHNRERRNYKIKSRMK
jgi:hypothetical protein